MWSDCAKRLRELSGQETAVTVTPRCHAGTIAVCAPRVSSSIEKRIVPPPQQRMDSREGESIVGSCSTLLNWPMAR
ncbi:hypothetical protein GCM10010464_75490 [Pseudonocardia yunnanensis]